MFQDNLKKCEFYDLDLENINNEKTKKKRERFSESILEDDLPVEFKKYEASIKYLDKAIQKTGFLDPNSVLMQFKNYSITHSPNLHLNS